MKNSRTPSGANTGLWSTGRLGDPYRFTTRVPETAESSFGARLPNVVPGNVEMLFCDAQTIHLPRGAQSQRMEVLASADRPGRAAVSGNDEQRIGPDEADFEPVG